MMVRVFVPGAINQTDQPSFSGTDHHFPVMPSVGHVLRFTGERDDEFIVARVGFVQDGEAFLAAAWLEISGAKQAHYSDPIDAVSNPDNHRYRDLNYDVSPDTMTGY